MGSRIELNDTLQITTRQGFPEKQLQLKKHRQHPYKTADFRGKVFEFRDKQGARVYHVPPTRNFLVHNINGKWLYWGKIEIIEQTIRGSAGNQTTSGKFRIIAIFDPAFQEQMTRLNSPEGQSSF